MKQFFFAILLASVSAFAEEASTTATTTETTTVQMSHTQNTPTHENPSWDFKIGFSSYESLANETGSGLTVGGAFAFNSFIGMGLDFTNFKLKANGAGSIQQDVDVLGLNVEITPIRYQFETTELTASMQVGTGTQKIAAGGAATTQAFYGASLAWIVNKKVGFSMGMRSSKDFASFSTVSIIGYF